MNAQREWFDHTVKVRGSVVGLVHPKRCRQQGIKYVNASVHSDGICAVATACMVWDNERHSTQYDTWELDRWFQAQGILPWHRWHQQWRTHGGQEIGERQGQAGRINGLEAGVCL